MNITEDFLSAEDFIALKKRITDEVRRRKYKSPTTTKYAAEPWVFTSDDMPTEDKEITFEQINKIITPINAIKKETAIQEIDSLALGLNMIDGILTVHESAKQCSNNTCGAVCTGMCIDSCSSCTDCTGSCDGCSNCTGTCDGCSGCTGGCNGGCTDDCSGCGGWCGGSSSNSGVPEQWP